MTPTPVRGADDIARDHRHDTDRPDVTVTIVTYNCTDDAIKCIDTLHGAAGRHRVEVVVVDNDSDDDVAAAIGTSHPEVKVIERRRNAGFGRSHNLAAAHASGRYLLVLNPDTVVEPGAIDEMVDFSDARAAEGDPVGVVAPMLLNPDGTDQLTARSFPTASAGIFGRRSPLTRWFPSNPWSGKFLRFDQVDRTMPWTVDWVSGAAMMVPRDLFESLEGFDPDFFMHFEDAELCARVGAAGRDVWCVPQGRIVHAEGGSRRGWPASQVWYFHRGAYLFARKTRYPGSSDPRRWMTAVLLGVRLIATIALNVVQRTLDQTTTTTADAPAGSTGGTRHGRAVGPAT